MTNIMDFSEYTFKNISTNYANSIVNTSGFSDASLSISDNLKKFDASKIIELCNPQKLAQNFTNNIVSKAMALANDVKSASPGEFASNILDAWVINGLPETPVKTMSDYIDDEYKQYFTAVEKNFNDDFLEAKQSDLFSEEYNMSQHILNTNYTYFSYNKVTGKYNFYSDLIGHKITQNKKTGEKFIQFKIVQNENLIQKSEKIPFSQLKTVYQSDDEIFYQVDDSNGGVFLKNYGYTCSAEQQQKIMNDISGAVDTFFAAKEMINNILSPVMAYAATSYVIDGISTYLFDSVRSIMSLDMSMLTDMTASYLLTYKQDAQSLLIEILGDQNDILDYHFQNLQQMAMGFIKEEIDNTIGLVTNKITARLGQINGPISYLSYYSKFGLVWMSRKSDQLCAPIVSNCNKEIGEIRDTINDKKYEYIENMAKKIAKKQADKINNELKTELKKVQDAINDTKMYVKLQAKQAMLIAKVKIMALVGL